MRYFEIAQPSWRWARSPLPNEAQLTVHIEHEEALTTLLSCREDAEAVERGISVMPQSTLVYVRCEDESVAAEIEAAWSPYHPSKRSGDPQTRR